MNKIINETSSTCTSALRAVGRSNCLLLLLYMRTGRKFISTPARIYTRSPVVTSSLHQTLSPKKHRNSHRGMSEYSRVILTR
jgi:hypothetical protein